MCFPLVVTSAQQRHLPPLLLDLSAASHSQVFSVLVVENSQMGTAVSSEGTAVSSRCWRQRSHTQHATLDGALFSVIDLLQPPFNLRASSARALAVTHAAPAVQHARLREEMLVC